MVNASWRKAVQTKKKSLSGFSGYRLSGLVFQLSKPVNAPKRASQTVIEDFHKLSRGVSHNPYRIKVGLCISYCACQYQVLATILD